jgi:hypothetical protein
MFQRIPVDPETCGLQISGLTFLDGAMPMTMNTSLKTGWFARWRRTVLIDSAFIVPWQIALPAWMFAAIVWILFMVWDVPERWKVFGGAMLIASASAAVGALLGFLFGMPRAAQGGAPNSSSGLLLSTHLQDVADWLTKLIVGAGLVQLGNLSTYLGNLGSYLSQGSGLTSSMAISIVLYFIALGFLLAYLWAELYISTLVARVQRTLDSSSVSLDDQKATVPEPQTAAARAATSQTA